jgi:endonuclease YncB( thermonuclease family)
MLKFPEGRVYRSRRLRRWRKFGFTLLLVFMFAAVWHFGDDRRTRKPIGVSGQKIFVADGDSFTIGARKLRLGGIDAPEYRQTCKDAAGQDWPCGRTARAALEKLLTEPGLACEAGMLDRYDRSLANCRTAATPDIAAALALAGMAVSDEYYELRSYGEEEDTAQAAKRGIWQGDFILPKEFRAGAMTAD